MDMQDMYLYHIYLQNMINYSGNLRLENLAQQDPNLPGSPWE